MRKLTFSLVLLLAAPLAQAHGQGVHSHDAGLFALFHGMGHGLEIPLAFSPWTYTAGMLAGTALLACLGVLAGARLRQVMLRQAGLRVAAVGAGLLLPLIGS